MNADQELKIKENRLRRMADRQGLALIKSKRRDPRSLDWQRFMIVDKFSNRIVAGELNSPQSLSIDEVEQFLLSPKPREET